MKNKGYFISQVFRMCYSDSCSVRAVLLRVKYKENILYPTHGHAVYRVA